MGGGLVNPVVLPVGRVNIDNRLNPVRLPAPEVEPGGVINPAPGQLPAGVVNIDDLLNGEFDLGDLIGKGVNLDALAQG